MKSFCIKTNHSSILHYLQNEFEEMNLDHVYLSKYTFKIYHNLILHYTGKDVSRFCEKVSKILSIAILLFFEKNLISQTITYHYFYFDTEEKKDILENCMELFDLENETTYLRYQYIYSSVYDYLTENKSMILEGFIQFRLFDYKDLLNSTVDMAVNKFIIDREYQEFIEVLRLYINTKSQKDSPEVHLIYHADHSFLLDSDKNILPINTSISTVNYLSDISFSSNDYVLNALLTLLPSKLTIHLIDPIHDEFIHTLQLIFQNKVVLCEECSFCHNYHQLTSLSKNDPLSEKR